MGADEVVGADERSRESVGEDTPRGERGDADGEMSWRGLETAPVVLCQPGPLVVQIKTPAQLCR
jgi:hypothetical protein